ncbi:MAG: hypothetical protein ACRD4S_01045 [Candidatus Acidiferrales bacterium]
MTPVTASTQAKTPAVDVARGARATDDEILGIIDDSRGGRRREILRGGVHPEANRRAPQNGGHSTGVAERNESPLSDGEPGDGGSRDGNDDDQFALEFDGESRADSEGSAESADANELSSPGDATNVSAALDASPELRRAWDDAHAYREAFATPGEAREATALVADLNRLDALFFSQRPEDHAELARAIANLDPAAFSSLARAMAGMSANASGNGVGSTANVAPGFSPASVHGNPDAALKGGATKPGLDSPAAQSDAERPAGLTSAQTEFFHATNSAAVERVLDAIESQVERLLPGEISKTARNRVVGEIYRELDGTLRSNRELGRQMRQAFRSGSLDAEHQRAIVSLVANRARQALPGVAKRVLNEWTTTLISANHERRARQRSAEGRVDIAGSSGGGNDGRRPIAPRDLDYKRLSDADILNM